MESKLINESTLVLRVIFESREFYRVMDQDLNIFSAEMAGRVRKNNVWPAVGDWVFGIPQPGGWMQIVDVIERQSVLSRRSPSGTEQILAANVDTLFIVTSANQDLNLNRLDRYVAMALGGGVRPVILINKIELAEDPHAVLDAVAMRFSSVDLYGVSVFEGWNLDCLEPYCMEGQTVAFVGSSGVGKSSLTNYLLDSNSAEVSEIRESDGRGRHTTTHRELHVLKSGAVVIDTPGIRTVRLMDDAGLESAFADIEELSSRCKFGNCAHANEPGCAVLSALEDGTLDACRLESYVKLGKEQAYERRRGDKALQAQEKKKWAKISMANRARMKRN